MLNRHSTFPLFSTESTRKAFLALVPLYFSNEPSQAMLHTKSKLQTKSRPDLLQSVCALDFKPLIETSNALDRGLGGVLKILSTPIHKQYEPSPETSLTSFHNELQSFSSS